MNKFSEYTDQELMVLISKKGSVAELAFGEVYARYSQKIYVYCLRVLENSEEANDAFQETFLKFVETYNAQPNVQNIMGLLIRIARNLCLNMKRSKRQDFQFNELLSPSYDDTGEDKELVELAVKALDLIDFEHREAFVLRLYEGLSYQEISEIVGASVSTVKNRYFRAKEKLKNILLPYLEEF